MLGHKLIDALFSINLYSIDNGFFKKKHVSMLMLPLFAKTPSVKKIITRLGFQCGCLKL